MYKCIQNIENEFILQFRWCKDPRTFISIFNGFVPDQAENPDVLQMLGSYAYLVEADYTKAIELLDRAVLKGNATALSTLGNCFMRMGNYGLALSTLLQGHAVGNTECTFSLGQFYQVAEPNEELMLLYYKQVPERSHYNLAVYYYCKKDYANSVVHLHAAEARRDTMTYFVLWHYYASVSKNDSLTRKYKFLAAVCTPKRLFDLGCNKIERFVLDPIDFFARFDEMMAVAVALEASPWVDLRTIHQDFADVLCAVF